MKILYLCTHQIHNLTPLFREISKNKKINFKVLYWQRILADYHDPEFDKIINFGIDQFSGYKYYCLFNDEKVKYDLSFVFKLKILVKLFFFLLKEDYDVIVSHGYTYPNIFALILSKVKGKKTIMRDISYNLGERKVIFKCLRYIYYRLANIFIDTFWTIHKLNEKFFLDFGANKKKFYFIDHCQGEYETLIKNNPNLDLEKNDFIKKYNLPLNKKIILFAGRFIERKNPIILFEAFIKSKISDDWMLIMAGAGKQKYEISEKIKQRNIKNTILLDFQSQQSLINFFIFSEILVLPSQLGDTHGNIACEAAQFKCALLLSNMVGLHPECEKDKLGLVFKFNDKSNLISNIEEITSDKKKLSLYQNNAYKFGKQKTPKQSAKLIFEYFGIEN